MQLGLYIRTLRYLKLRQLWYQGWYRARGMFRRIVGFRHKYAIPAAGHALALTPYIPKYTSLKDHGKRSFEFLNLAKDDPDWSFGGFGNLWNYNLNYMDFLLQRGAGFERGVEWIDGFIKNAETNKMGFDPYPIALRGINWVKFISTYADSIPADRKQQWDASLYAQYKILSDSLEYHLLGNHLLEDAYSLLWGALYFEDAKLYRKAEKLLRAELAEQVLGDGGHYELSPMYHMILLDRLLDCVNAAGNTRFEGQEKLVDFMRGKASAMLGWLEAVIYRDGSVPLLNDSAYGIAPAAGELFDYALRLGLSWVEGALSDSGYRKLDTGRVELIADVGRIGPDYIPGHAHADTFNYELRIDGQPFAVDTGISTYEKNDRRQYERGTTAHNTVVVENGNSSEVWGGFRVGRRARITHLDENGNFIKTCHDGFRRSGCTHERSFSLTDECLSIQDRLLPEKGHRGVGFIILSPEVKIMQVGDDRIVTDKGTIIFYNVRKIEIEECCVSKEYNVFISTRKICYSFTDNVKYDVCLNV